ncbi:MAG: response regulator transcription factor [Eubacterium sp.]|nr:response regulator transcription factor [Eubacterium sp.]
MNRILIVEDNVEIQNMETELLTKSGYETVSAYSGTEALLLVDRESFDLIILDIMLPGMQGDEVLKNLRGKTDAGILCVSALDALDTRVSMMREGADDYIVKPFENSDLLVRIEAILRRIGKRDMIDASEKLTFKDIEIDSENHTAVVGGSTLDLTRKEFEILELMVRNPKKVFTKDNIYESVWGEEYIPEDNTVNVHVSNIRKKLEALGNEKEYIKTVWGIGFKMSE